MIDLMVIQGRELNGTDLAEIRGPIRVAQLLSVVVMPYRFTNKRAFWAYVGLGIVTLARSPYPKGCMLPWFGFSALALTEREPRYTMLEERDLRGEFGQTYCEYQATVPMLIPIPHAWWHRRRSLGIRR